MNAPSEPALQDQLRAMADEARLAQRELAALGSSGRTRAILAMAEAVRRRGEAIAAANGRDLERAEAAGVAPAVRDRLSLAGPRLQGLSDALSAIAAQPDPIGTEMARWTPPSRLDIARVRTPIGLIAMIYESRPNVTVEAAGLCVRSANSVILRPGSDAHVTCSALAQALQEGLAEAGAPPAAVQIAPSRDRAAVGFLLAGLDGRIDLIVPRGGRSLVERVAAEARAPILGHLEGLCHTFLHASADPAMALSIVLNAKLRRPSVCGATETLLVDRSAAGRLLPPIAEALIEAGCELRADPEALTLCPGARPAAAEDFRTEHLAAILNVGLVDGVDGAAAHIARFGSGHTEAIVAEDAVAAETFLNSVDSAVVFWNASTQFSDGGEFGFGGEIGISTSRLHARGPIGAEQLTSFKYVVRGRGQVRP